jgi:DNA recombination protein RmuC
MLYVLLAVDLVVLLTLGLLLLRRPQAATESASDPRLAQLLSADLPTQFTRLDTHFQGLDQYIRAELAAQRNEAAADALRSREAAEAASAALRQEVLAAISTLGDTLQTGFGSFRTDNTNAAERLRTAVDNRLDALAERLTGFTSEATHHATDSREALHTRLTELGSALQTGLKELGAAQTEHQEKLRTTVEARLDALNLSNSAKLEEMRQTVDEKLQATLQDRLTKSFGQVTDQLTKVHTGLGEMSKLSAGVDDLSRIFTNVKSRGTIGEVMLETLLKQMLAPNQFVKNPKVKPNSQEMVEFAVKLPTPSGEALLPIDSKFVRESWERLETAYATGTDIASAGKAFETAIRNEGKKICEKYIAPPTTTSFAIMFLPTEGMYAEVMRRDGLQSDIQQNCHVTIAGPSTLSAILSSFQMGFHMLQLQQKGDDVWKVLANARTQFGKFEDLMGRMSKDVEKVQNTLGDVATRTRAINRTLRDVSLEPEETMLASTGNAGFDGYLPMLAANGEDAGDNA